jgi:hypothetical protein
VSFTKQYAKTILGIAIALMTVCDSKPALSEPTENVVSGTTGVQLSNELVSALGSLQIQPGVVSGSALSRSGIALFPITGGVADLGTIKTEIIHAGGLSLTSSRVRVELTDFVISTLGETPVLTGVVIANGSVVGRAPLFNLALPAVTPPLEPIRGTIIDLPNVGVTLTSDAAGLLNSTFGVNAFTSGFNIGTARVRAIVDAH